MLRNPLKYKVTLSILCLIMLSCSLLTPASFVNTQDQQEAEVHHIQTSSNAEIEATGLSTNRTIPLYGFNGNNIRGPEWSNPELLNSIKSLQMKIIRYPGGTIGEWWDWKKGWFIDDTEATPLPPEYKKVPFVRNNLDDLKLLVNTSNCQVIFTLNMITSTLQDQLNMLKYAKQIGLPVKWIELGNEDNLPKSIGMKKFDGPFKYAQTCKLWIDTLRDYFPDAEIAIVGGNQFFNSDVKNWNKNVIKSLNNKFAIVAHPYPPASKIIDDNGINFEKLHNELHNIFDKQGFTEMSTNKNIWITEYNIHWFDTNKKEIQKYATSWGNALAILLMTSEITDFSPKVTMLINHNLTGIPAFAAIETMHKTFQYLPNGIAMNIWLNTSSKMQKMQKIQLKNNNQIVPDYTLFGWKFTNKGDSSLLFVNLSNSAINLNLEHILSGNMKYECVTATKEAQISSGNDIKHINGSTVDKSVSLPAYSITKFAAQ